MSVILRTRQLPKLVNHCRCISLSINKRSQNETDSTDFKPIYKFPYIFPMSLVNRLKVYQTALTVTTTPGAIVLNQLNYISNDALFFTATLGITGCITLYSLGYLTYKFVGFIYYNEETDVIKISYIDFWGRRRDIEVPATDIVPLSDTPVTIFDGSLFQTFRRFSTKETLKLCIRFGIILDKDKISKIL